ncbi:MAG TPA: hypothetical protein VNA26_06190, partial [Chitinophagaceae bacterium]|nr:hypothetical protein [Chitinophagaceae bacterium]
TAIAKKTTPFRDMNRPYQPPGIKQKAVVKNQNKKPATTVKAPVIKKEEPGTPSKLNFEKRSKSVLKTIEIELETFTVQVYDNGEIDGDTVSIYHNNTLLVAHARLSEKPISFRITVDAERPHHELIMVAENLGSIPPNTSLMIVTAGSKRYQVFISSTEQKNAKLVLNLKE